MGRIGKWLKSLTGSDKGEETKKNLADLLPDFKPGDDPWPYVLELYSSSGETLAGWQYTKEFIKDPETFEHLKHYVAKQLLDFRQYEQLDADLCQSLTSADLQEAIENLINNHNLETVSLFEQHFYSLSKDQWERLVKIETNSEHSDIVWILKYKAHVERRLGRALTIEEGQKALTVRIEKEKYYSAIDLVFALEEVFELDSNNRQVLADKIFDDVLGNKESDYSLSLMTKFLKKLEVRDRQAAAEQYIKWRQELANAHKERLVSALVQECSYLSPSAKEELPQVVIGLIKAESDTAPEKLCDCSANELQQVAQAVNLADWGIDLVAVKQFSLLQKYLDPTDRENYFARVVQVMKKEIKDLANRDDWPPLDYWSVWAAMLFACLPKDFRSRALDELVSYLIGLSHSTSNRKKKFHFTLTVKKMLGQFQRLQSQD